MTDTGVSAGHRVELEVTGRVLTVPSGTLILDALRSFGIYTPADCGGQGICGQCRVYVSGKKLSPPEAAERMLLTPDEQNKGIRLACCSPITSDIKIRLPEKTSSAGIRLQVDGMERRLAIDPVIRPVNVALPQADLQNPAQLQDLIAQALVSAHNDETLTKALPSTGATLEHQGTKKVRFNACLRDRELIAVLPEKTVPVGLAVDLGTTKIAGYLMDLTTGETLAAAGILNPQGRFGADIMTRLQHACDTSVKKDLVQTIRHGVDGLVLHLAESAGVDCQHVVDACIVANTAMVHLLLDLPVKQMARAPYAPSTLQSFNIKAGEMGLNISPQAKVYIPPAIGGFVGADHVAMIMAADIDQLDQIVIGLDIGTNTEIVLKRPGRDNLYCLSCPSGPAFEGAHISTGMHAAAGAIEKVRLTDTLEPRYTTIDHAPAIGLCGSAMIDVVSELHRSGLINGRGRFKDEIKLENNKFLLVPPSESGTGEAIWFHQKDIDEILLAKGAIRAGIEILLQVSKTRPDQVNHVFIAGAFGAYINLINATHIGLIPQFPSAGFHQIGNAAAIGAKQALVQCAARQRAEQIPENTHHIELTRQPGFNRHFARGIMLPKNESIPALQGGV